MDKCITCGRELHPERAKKYNYCMSRECQEKNAKGLTMVAIGMNKAAEEYLILDDKTKEELASGKFRDQRREFFGPIARTPDPAQTPAAARTASTTAPPTTTVASKNAAATAPAKPSRPRSVTRTMKRQPWSRSQQKLALLYNEQGLRPDEIARKLGLSTYVVTQIILDSRSRGKL